MDNREKLILEIIKECAADGEPVTRAEAEEMADLELKAKGSRHYETDTTKERKKASKPRKVDEEKLQLLQMIAEVIPAETDFRNEAEINFVYNNSNYSLKLIRHKPLKN